MLTLKEITREWRKQKEKGVRVIAFGSSNTELHWHSLGRHNWFTWLGCSIRQKIGRHVTPINQGISGETADDLLKRIERDVIAYSPNLVIVTIGGNDANMGIPVERYRENMNLIVEKIQKIGAVPVLQTYYCPLYEKMSEPFQRFPEFVEVNRTLASEKEIPLIDQYKFFSAFYENDRENYSKLMLDGLHVNPIGNTIMGIIACRSFNVPDPILMLDPKIIEDKKEIAENLRLMKKFSNIPSRSRRIKE